MSKSRKRSMQPRVENMLMLHVDMQVTPGELQTVLHKFIGEKLITRKFREAEAGDIWSMIFLHQAFVQAHELLLQARRRGSPWPRGCDS